MVAAAATASASHAERRSVPKDVFLERDRSPAARERLHKVVSDEYEFVWRSLRRLGVLPPETDDATQQVFIVLAQKLGDVEVGKERSYLFSIALRVAANTRRAHAKLREVAEDEAANVPCAAPMAETVLDHAYARAVLDELLARMPDERRAVFVLSELEELPLAEIASMLQLPPNTVASRLRRAREEMRAAIVRFHARKQGG